MDIRVSFCIDYGNDDMLNYKAKRFDSYNYDSFDDIIKLENYDKIYRIECYGCGLTELPELPKYLKELNCSHNKIKKLPKLPKYLWCLVCSNNKLTYLPEYPQNLQWLSCDNNFINHLPVHNNNFIIYSFSNNPVDNFVWDYFYKYNVRQVGRFYKWNKKTQKQFADKIGTWFLDCKYNPKYSYCRKRLLNEYNSLFNK